MTDHEKKINKVDLTSYKHLQNNYDAILPGKHHINSVASVQLAHFAAPETDLQQ